MMVDDFENKQFTDLLKSYAEPVRDGGFSADVLANLPRVRSRHHLKRPLILAASVLGALFAVPQMLKLQSFIGTVSLPTYDLPEIGLPDSLSYTMVAFSLLALMLVWIGGSLFIGDDM